MFDLYIIDVWRNNSQETWPICDIVTGAIKISAGTSTTRGALEQN